MPIRCTVEQGDLQTKLTWRGRFTSLLVKQTKVSQEDPRHVFFFFSFTKVRITALVSFWHFLLFSTDSTNMFLCSVPFPPTSLQCSRGVFFQETVPLCTPDALQGEFSYSHQGPVQHNRTCSFPYTAHYLSDLHLQSEVVNSK